MNARNRVFGIVAVIVGGVTCLVALLFGYARPVQLISGLTWHAASGSQVVFGGLQYRLPRGCWVSDKSTSEITIVVTPFWKSRTVGMFVLKHRTLIPDSLLPERKRAGLEREGYEYVGTDTIEMGGTSLAGVLMRERKNGDFYATYTLPARQLVVHGIALSSDHLKTLKKVVAGASDARSN